jgi:alpha-galactosidase
MRHSGLLVPAVSCERTGHLIHLSAAATSLLLDISTGVPRVLHWGSRLSGPLEDDAAYLGSLRLPQRGADSLRGTARPAVVPDAAEGWTGFPGLQGHRQGRSFSATFPTGTHLVEQTADTVGVHSCGRDEAGELELETRIEMLATGLVRLRALVRNTAGGAAYTVDGLSVTLPVPTEAQEILDFAGRHLRERTPQRHSFTVGTHLREGRRGRTGSDAAFLLVAGTRGFGFGAGELWAVHTAWSGNHRTYAELTLNGSRVLGGGEVLLPGEIVLGPGESYQSPWVYGVHGHGLDAAGATVHDFLRSRPQHPRSPRPVILNTWEAVYFDHDADTLLDLAERAARVGVERFVLDDGWFMHRRDDKAGLGDWAVDPAVWPEGLHPLVEGVRRLGMQFGLWFEPEMVNDDSDLARAHPEWILAPGERLPISGRHQHVLNLAIPEAFDHVLARISDLVEEYRIDYIKWDHNRDLVEAGDRTTGEPRVHRQTRAAYALMDELRRRHAGLEIESCSSGGGRVDLEVLERTDRVWASDCIDPLERQQIQRWTSLLLPPELIGSHVGAPTAHTTHRTHSLAFRAATALFGHFGIEWDLRSASDQEIEELARWVTLYKQERALIHTGRTFRSDYPDDSYWAHGVVAPTADRALVAFVAMHTATSAQPGRIRVPGLDPSRRYRIEPVELSASALVRTADGPPPWYADRPTISGSTLDSLGIQAPMLYPEQALVVRLTAVPS